MPNETQLIKSIMVSASGLRAQSERMRVIAENMANADSLPQAPGLDPYRRKTVSFKSVMDREQNVDLVKIKKVGFDRSDFTKAYDPGHPGADNDGYVLKPNVNTLIEAMDMREAQRSYEANVNALETARSMLMRTISILNN
ncbi:MAG: flagellar basal body rod protein FlgC [Alphaproteobacteria bacterium]|nr:flagellar basal body rod protein FlgC [Alphaproteobacteria bacterium]